MAVLSPFTGRLSDRVGSRALAHRAWSWWRAGWSSWPTSPALRPGAARARHHRGGDGGVQRSQHLGGHGLGGPLAAQPGLGVPRYHAILRPGAVHRGARVHRRLAARRRGRADDLLRREGQHRLTRTRSPTATRRRCSWGPASRWPGPSFRGWQASSGVPLPTRPRRGVARGTARGTELDAGRARQTSPLRPGRRGPGPARPHLGLHLAAHEVGAHLRRPLRLRGHAHLHGRRAPGGAAARAAAAGAPQGVLVSRPCWECCRPPASWGS